MPGLLQPRATLFFAKATDLDVRIEDFPRNAHAVMASGTSPAVYAPCPREEAGAGPEVANRPLPPNIEIGGAGTDGHRPGHRIASPRSPPRSEPATRSGSSRSWPAALPAPRWACRQARAASYRDPGSAGAFVAGARAYGLNQVLEKNPVLKPAGSGPILDARPDLGGAPDPGVGGVVEGLQKAPTNIVLSATVKPGPFSALIEDAKTAFTTRLADLPETVRVELDARSHATHITYEGATDIERITLRGSTRAPRTRTCSSTEPS